MAECRLDTHVGHTGRALPMLATAMLRDSELGHAAICLVSYLWLWGTVATMWELRLWGIRAHPDQNWPRDTELQNSMRPIPLLIQGQNVGIGVQPVCHSGTRDGMYPYANWPSDTPTLAHMYAACR